MAANSSKKIIPFGQEVASHRAVVVISHQHVHCPCSSCDGRAVDRGTELRHWKESQIDSKTRSGLNEFCKPLPGSTFNPTENGLLDEEEQMDEDTEGMQYDSNNESDVDEVESRVNFPRARRAM